MNSDRHVMGCRSIRETRVRNAFDDVDSARHVIGGQLLLLKRARNAFDDVASAFLQSLWRGGPCSHGRGCIEILYSTGVESPPPPPHTAHVCLKNHPEGELCSDLGSVLVFNDPPARRALDARVVPPAGSGGAAGRRRGRAVHVRPVRGQGGARGGARGGPPGTAHAVHSTAFTSPPLAGWVG
jgi:hypothetical protein